MKKKEGEEEREEGEERSNWDKIISQLRVRDVADTILHLIEQQKKSKQWCFLVRKKEFNLQTSLLKF